MIKEDKQLENKFYKIISKAFVPADLWNWINKYYVSKKWVEKELIGEGVDGYGGNNKEEYNKCLNRNEFRQEQRNKLKEKNEK
jgi:hypothetical protein